MIPAEAVEAAAKGMCGTLPLSQWEYKSQEARDLLLANARQALQAAAPHMLAAAWDEGYSAESDYAPPSNPYRSTNGDD